MGEQTGKKWGMINGLRRMIGVMRPLKVEEDEETIWLRHMGEQFKKIAGDDGQIDLAEFKGALKVKDSFFADRFFALFDKDGSGSLELDELLEGLHQITKGTRRDKLKFLFDIHDVDGSGTIDHSEMKDVLKSCVAESSLKVSDEDLEELTTVLFESADADGSGTITFDEMMEEFEKHPQALDSLTISAAQWLKPPSKEKTRREDDWRRVFTKRFIQNNLRLIIFILVYLLINVGLFVLNAVRYRSANYFVIIARGFGMGLNFNCSFIVVLMLRYTLTWLRMTPLRHILPFDESVMLHKLVGYMICIQTVGHTIAHLGNIGLVTKGSSEQANSSDATSAPSLEYWEYLFTLRAGIGFVGPGFAYISGVTLDIILLVMFLASLSFVRRGGYFLLFYYTHMLFIAFWALLIMHGPIFWYFFIIPGIIFIVEKIYGLKIVKVARLGQMYVKEVNLLPSRVTHLVITKPKKFHYKPGDYVFINIPDVAANEWHPFTISSAPELKGAFWLHIRGAGNWTNRLHDFFSQYEETAEDLTVKMENGGHMGSQTYSRPPSRLKTATAERTTQAWVNGKTNENTRKVCKTNKKSRHKVTKVKCYIDGPCGSPTREIMDVEHAVLIASGIGVTPYASILQSIMYRHHAARVKCPKCQNTWYPEVAEEILNVKKVDFIWINRDQKCFEWFVSLLTQLEAQEASDGSFDRFFDMQMYMTSAASKNDMKGIGLQMALELLHEKRGTDIITGLKTRTKPGRPDWKEVFTQINQEKKGAVKVFFCGSPALAKQLKVECDKYGFGFLKETF